MNESTLNLVELSQRIKKLRREKGLTLEQVASETGLTRSWLSKVENFRITPSLQALGHIAAVLKVPMSELLSGIDQQPLIALVRRDARKRVERDDSEAQGTVYESLAHSRPTRIMDPFFLSIAPGGGRRNALGHEGEEFLMVLAGEADFHYGEEVYHLSAGDCLYFDARMPHRVANPTCATASVLCVFSEAPSTLTQGEESAPADAQKPTPAT
ncbi:MAG: cupin domain-containing protein [Lentisphaerae bacterium]|nr:cupin domain-containing protein [Lentisphaerota bacterium]